MRRATVELLLRRGLLALLWMVSLSPVTEATESHGDLVQRRLDTDLAAGRPIVVHTIVALCDNIHQGIVPVPAALGNGQDPDSNLYWGALFGVRTHLSRVAGWSQVATEKPSDDRILERVVFQAEIERHESPVPVYLVADAWDGASLRAALATFLEMTAGRLEETIELRHDSRLRLRAGGAAHLVAYVGHNGLMDFSSSLPSSPAIGAPARGAAVLACASKPYFLPHLEAAKAHPVLLTTGLMAPEAYTLEALVRAWVGGGETAVLVEAAAEAYDRYQETGLGAARRLFWSAKD